MQLMLKTIMPRSDEIIWYVFFGSIALVALNILGILDALFALSQTDADVQETINASFVGFIRDVSQPLNGRLGNSLVWAFMGLLAFTLGSVAVSEVQDLFDHTEQAKQTPGRYRAPIWIEFLVRTAIRTTAFIGIIIWLYTFASVIRPWISKLLLDSLFAPHAYIWGTLTFVLGSIVFGLSIYVVAVLARFVALRVRVFSPVS